jgi:hypothetical protein
MKPLLLLVLASCLTQPSPPVFDDSAIAAACTDEATAACDLRHTCDVITPDGLAYDIEVTYGDVQTCITRTAQTCIDNLHVADQGTTVDHVEQCAQTLPAETCSNFYDNDPTARCEQQAGPGAIGSSCAAIAQCSTAFCATAAHQVCGTCQPLPLAGATCSGSSDCGHGLVCAIPPAGSMSMGVCPPVPATGTCAAVVADGMPCLTGTFPCIEGDMCFRDNPSSGTMGTCMPVAPLGATCDNARQTAPSCDSHGLACSTGTCQPTLIAQPGEPCGLITGRSTTCIDGGLCVKSTHCMATGTCVAAAADGAPCSIDPTTGPPCFSPATCVVGSDGMTGTCRLSNPAACF